MFNVSALLLEGALKHASLVVLHGLYKANKLIFSGKIITDFYIVLKTSLVQFSSLR